MANHPCGVFTQPALGRVADAYSYPASFIAASIIQFLALPFIYAARKQNIPEDSK